MLWTLWQDANYAGPRGDVAAGLAGLGFVIGFGVFVASTAIGAGLGFVATRRAPEARSATLALGVNIVSLLGVLLSAALLVLLR